MFGTAASRAGRKRSSPLGAKVPGYLISDGAAFAINPANGGVQYVSLGAARTPVFSGWVDGDSVVLFVKSNGFALDYSSLNVLWENGAPPRLSASGVTAILFERYAGVYIGSDPYPTVNEVLYVGGIQTSGNNNSTVTPSNSLTALTGGIDAVARAGDLVVNIIAGGTVYFESLDTSMSSSGYTELLDVNAQNASNVRANIGVHYKFMSATPDTTCVGSIPGASGRTYIQQTRVFRNVDPNNPFDCAYQLDSNTANSVPDASSFSPVSQNGMILGAGVSVSSEGYAMTAPQGLNSVLNSGPGANSYNVSLSSGIVPRPIGSVNLPAYGISNDTNGASIALMLALRALL